MNARAYLLAAALAAGLAVSGTALGREPSAPEADAPRRTPVAGEEVVDESKFVRPVDRAKLVVGKINATAAKANEELEGQ